MGPIREEGAYLRGGGLFQKMSFGMGAQTRGGLNRGEGLNRGLTVVYFLKVLLMYSIIITAVSSCAYRTFIETYVMLFSFLKSSELLLD